MSHILHRSVCSLGLVGLLAGSAVRLQGQGDTWIIRMNAPEQLVEILDERGRLRQWHFQANARVADTGRATGGAVLERGSERYEFRYQSAIYVLNDAGGVEMMTFVGEGVKTTGNRDKGFGFVEMATPEDASGSGAPNGFAVFDITGLTSGTLSIGFECLMTLTMR